MRCLILVVIMLLICDSCTQIQTKIEAGKNYKLDISIKTRNPDEEAIGMTALGVKSLHTIEFEAPAKINYISFKTCSREIVQEDPSSGLNRKKYLINYKPNEIELAGACPAVISAYSEKGMMTMGYIEFEDYFATLKAKNICGERSEDTMGVSVCQGRVGSIERLKFDTEVIISPDPGCELGTTRGKEFTYKIKEGYCIYGFMEVATPNRIHRHVTYGYTDIQIR